MRLALNHDVDDFFQKKGRNELEQIHHKERSQSDAHESPVLPKIVTDE